MGWYAWHRAEVDVCLGEAGADAKRIRRHIASRQVYRGLGERRLARRVAMQANEGRPPAGRSEDRRRADARAASVEPRAGTRPVRGGQLAGMDVPDMEV